MFCWAVSRLLFKASQSSVLGESRREKVHIQQNVEILPLYIANISSRVTSDRFSWTSWTLFLAFYCFLWGLYLQYNVHHGHQSIAHRKPLDPIMLCSNNSQEMLDVIYMKPVTIRHCKPQVSNESSSLVINQTRSFEHWWLLLARF